MAHSTNLIEKITVGGTTYDIHDANALHSIEDLNLATVLTFAGTDTAANILKKSGAKKGEVWLASDTNVEYVCIETFSGATSGDATKWEKLGNVHDAASSTHTHKAASTGSAAPSGHTHTVTVSGNTGNNTGSAVAAVTGYNSFSGGSGGLTADDTTTTGIKYVESVTHTPASLSGTVKFVTGAIKSAKATESTTSTDGPQYVKSVTHTPATLTGTTSFNTDAIKSVTLSASSTSTDGPAYLQSLSRGSGSLKAYDAITDGNAVVSSGRIGVVTDVAHTSPTLGGTKTFVTGVSGGSGSLTSNTTSTNGIVYVEQQGTFTPGTTPPQSATPKYTTTATTGAGSHTVASVSNGVLTIAASISNHTHNYDKTTEVTLNDGTAPSLGAATRKYLHHTHNAASSSGTGTVTLSGGGVTVTKQYLEHAHNASTATTKYMKVASTAASKASVGIEGGSIDVGTRYMKITTEAAGTGTVGINGGGITAVTKYLVHTHTPASLGAASTANAAPHTHKHSYGSSTALTTSANSGTAISAITAIGAPQN
jgi:hypothetical protein